MSRRRALDRLEQAGDVVGRRCRPTTPARTTPPRSAQAELVDDLDGVGVAGPRGDALGGERLRRRASGAWPSTVKATVGVRSSIVGGPQTRTPGDRRQALEQRARTPPPRRAPSASEALVEQEPGGGVDGGDGLEARRAGLPTPRATVGGRADLGHRQLVEQRRVGAQHAGVRAVPLVGARRRARRSRAPRRRSRRCGARCTASTNTRGPGVVGGGHDRCQVGDRAEQVGRAGDGAPTRVRSSISSMTAAGSSIAGGRVERRQHVLGAGCLAGQPPRRDVGVVVEPRADDAVAGPQRRGDGPGEGQRQRRHVGAEARSPSGRAAEQRRRPLARVRSSRASQASAALNEPPVLALLPLAAQSAIAVDRGVDHLRAGRTVEAGPAVADTGEAVDK